MPNTVGDKRGDLTPELLRDPIGTRRLVMRLPTADDIVAISRLINEPDIALNTGAIRYPYAPISAWGWLAQTGRMRKNGAFRMPYLLTLRSNPRLFAGVAGLSVHPRRGMEIGYWLGKAYRGRGYASEAARALVSLAFLQSATASVQASARTSNRASQRVLEAAGMRRVGHSRIKSVQLGRYVPVILYRIERAAWELGTAKSSP